GAWHSAEPATVSPASLIAVDFLDAMNGGAVGVTDGATAFLTTSDGGNSWVSHVGPALPSTNEVDLALLNSQIAWILTPRPSGSAFSPGELWQTVNGGATFQQLSTP